MSINWSDEEAKIVHEMIMQDKLYREISATLTKHGFDRSPEAVRKFHKRNQDDAVLEDGMAPSDYDIIEPMLDEQLHEKYHIAIQKVREMRDRLVRVTGDKFVKVGKPVNADFKVLSISDMHVPFENPKVIEFLIQQHADADVLVLNGDIFEMFVVSKWPKSKVVLLRHEYEIAAEWMKLFVNIFPKIVLVSGNHEHRMQSYFSATIDPAVNFMVSDDILMRLKKGYAFEEDGTFTKKYNWEDQVFYDGGILRYYTIIGKTIFIHPNDFSGVPMRTAINWTNDLIDKEDFECMVMAHCFSEDTELLTDQGWRDIDTIKDTDNPLTLNLETNLLEFNPCQGIHKYTDHKELIAFENNTGLEVLVTPEHGMVYSIARNLDEIAKWKKATALEIEDYNRIYIPASGILDNEDGDISDQTLKLLAWVMTESSIQYTSANNPYIKISQSDDGSGSVKEIEDLLVSLDLEYTKTLRYEAGSYEHGHHRNYDAYNFRLGTEQTKQLVSFLNAETKTLKHEILTSLSLRQRRLLINEMCKGDGSKCGTDHYCHYYTANKALLDQFQILCTLSGIKNKANIRRKDGTWVVSMTDTILHTVTSSERRPYGGRTWCLTVPNGTLVARRKGVVFITQNTHKMGSYIWRNKLLLEQGSCCVPLDYEAGARARKSLQSYGGAVVYMDKEGHVDFDRTKNIYYGTGSAIKVEDALRLLQ